MKAVVRGGVIVAGALRFSLKPKGNVVLIVCTDKLKLTASELRGAMTRLQVHVLERAHFPAEFFIVVVPGHASAAVRSAI